MAFNQIAILHRGETVKAISRDMLSRWLQIPLPGQLGKTGWVSIQTRYSVVDGDVRMLPVVDTTDWPAGAYLRNCTHHEMLAMPGEYYIPSAYEFPDNEISVFPGVYSVYDVDMSDEIEVMSAVEIREGVVVEIREDASGERRKCP